MLDGEFDQRRISYLGFVLNRRFLLLLIGLLQVSVPLHKNGILNLFYTVQRCQQQAVPCRPNRKASSDHFRTVTYLSEFIFTLFWLSFLFCVFSFREEITPVQESPLTPFPIHQSNLSQTRLPREHSHATCSSSLRWAEDGMWEEKLLHWILDFVGEEEKSKATGARLKLCFFRG